MIRFNPGVGKMLSLLVVIASCGHHVHGEPPDSMGIHYGDHYQNTWWPGISPNSAITFIHDNIGHVRYMRTWMDPIQCDAQWQACKWSDEELTLMDIQDIYKGNLVKVMVTITAASAKKLADAQIAFDSDPNSPASHAMDDYFNKLQDLINKYNTYATAFLRYLAVSSEPNQPGDGYLDPNVVLQAVKYLKRRLPAPVPDNTPNEVPSGVYLTVPFSMGVVANSYPPWDGYFNMATWGAIMNDLLKEIAFFSINLYPYQTCAKWTQDIPYCLGGGNASDPVGPGKYHLHYTSIIEAQLDAVRAALYKIDNTRGATIPIAVTEIGWATAGTDYYGTYANPANACYFNNYLLRWIKSGTGTPGYWMNNTTPAARVIPQQVYFFEAFNENMKVNDPSNSNAEQYLGIYKANSANNGGVCAYTAPDLMDWSNGLACMKLPQVPSAADSHHDLALALSVSPATPQPNSVFDLKITVTAQAPTAPTAAVPGLDAVPQAEATPAAAVDGMASDAAADVAVADNAVVEEAGAPQPRATSGAESVNGVAVAPQHGGSTPPGALNVKVTFTLGSKASFVSVAVSNKQGSRAEGHLLVPANNNNGGSCSYKRSTHQVECSFPSLAYGSSKVIVIKLKPQVGYHEHHVVATSSHEGFLAEGGHPVTAYVTHRACHPYGSTSGGCSSTTSANTCCSDTCVGRMVGRRMKYYCA